MSDASPRIWRSPRSNFYGDECLDAAAVYTEGELQAIAAEGFNGIWLRGRLYDLMQSTVLPQLNGARRDERIKSLRTTIDRGRARGVGVWLFFNEPLAPRADAPFWKDHEELKGASHLLGIPGEDIPYIALCTSHPTVTDFLREAIAQVLTDLPALAGVILITASEHHSHCWSHQSLPGQQFFEHDLPPQPCPRCRTRRPEAVVSELVQYWADAAAAQPVPPRVIAWNWSWSMWYADPQKPVIDALPRQASLMADFERGDERPFQGRMIKIDEYSLGFVGPSRRFLGSNVAARAGGRKMLAKLQLGTTHELATVPNLPLLKSLHGKLLRMHRLEIDGFMGCWNFGCSRTLNTAAVRIFLADPDRLADTDDFYSAVAREALGLTDHAAVAQAWDDFTAAFELYPFSLDLLYYSFINYAPALPFSLEYHRRPMGPSWLSHHPFGDDIPTGIKPFSPQEVQTALEAMHRRWSDALERYLPELQNGSAAARQEASCAAMIGIHLRSAANIMRFHFWRLPQIKDRTGSLPWNLERNAELMPIIQDEIENVRAAIALADADPRLGYHQECQAYFYTGNDLRQKLTELERL